MITLKLPWISLKQHDRIVSIIHRQAVERDQELSQLRHALIEQDNLIKDLGRQLNEEKAKNNKPPRKASQPTQDGPSFPRGAWRARAQRMTEASVPVENDSVTNLQMRVKKEGGVD